MTIISKILAGIVVMLATPLVFIIHVWSIAVSAEESFSEWMKEKIK